MSKKPTIASLQARIADLEAKLAACQGGVDPITTDVGLVRYNMPTIGKKGINFTASAVDAIRLYTWAAKERGDTKKIIIASLISQQFTPSTVRARVARIFDGTDESCYSEEIRGRLGLDDMDEVEEDEGEE